VETENTKMREQVVAKGKNSIVFLKKETTTKKREKRGRD